MEVRFPDGEPSECVVNGKKVPNGSFIAVDQVILEYTRPDKSIGKLKNPTDGVVMFEKSCVKGFKPNAGTVLFKIEQCNHAIVIKDLCASCGKDLRTEDGVIGMRKENTSASVSMIHHVPELIVSDELAKELGTKDQAHVLAARKLVLLVDLDQTIIHTTNKPHGSDLENKTDITRYHLCGGVHYTKLRPYTKEFLENMSKLYEMHIVTYGQRQYAHKIADIIDPERKFFGQRVLSRDELFSQQHKTMNLKALFPCGDQLIAIIDDRADVWQFSEALVQVKPYRYFKEVGDINAPKGHRDEPRAEISNNDDDRILEDLERILTNIHTAFYKHYDTTKEIKDLKVVISWLRSQVMRDMNIVLSGIVPLDVRQDSSEIYRLCKQFGAKLLDTVTDETTHVVAARWGTTKVNLAIKKSIPIVTPAWVLACAEKWVKADEKEFELTKDMIIPATGSLGGRINELANLPTMGKGDMKNMCAEVDEALGDDDDDDNDDNDEEQEDSAEVNGEDEEEELEQIAQAQKRPREASVEEYVPSDNDDLDINIKKARMAAQEEDSDAEDNKSDQDYGDEPENETLDEGGSEKEEIDDEEAVDEADSDDDMAAELEHMME